MKTILMLGVGITLGFGGYHYILKMQKPEAPIVMAAPEPKIKWLPPITSISEDHQKGTRIKSGSAPEIEAPKPLYPNRKKGNSQE